MNYFNQCLRFAKSGGICGVLLLIRPLIYLLFSRRRDLDAYSSIDFSALVFIAYAFVCFIVAWKSLYKSKSPFGRILMTKTPLVWFIVFTIYGGISMLWSVSFTLTAFRAFECMAMILLIVAIMQSLFTTCRTDKIIDWVILYVVVEILFSLLRTLRWTTSPSALLESSQMMSTVFFFLALYYPRKRWYHYLIMVMALFSGSTVAYIGMAAGSISVLWTNTKHKVPIFLGVLAVATTIVVIGPEKVLKETVFHDKESVSLEETSGRDKLMEVAIETMETHPWGLGFFAGEPDVLYSRGLGAINAHNSLFSAGIGLGYIGVLVMGIFLIRMFFTVFSRKIPIQYRAPLIGCFFVGFLHCMGNPALGSRVFGAWIPVTFLFTLICSFYVYGRYAKKV
ncbi:MAG: hypothetical protein E7091_06050 [Bacteroidales bacterium]|nr:hypothetical protein [Bacteroidales bacterium]